LDLWGSFLQADDNKKTMPKIEPSIWDLCIIERGWMAVVKKMINLFDHNVSEAELHEIFVPVLIQGMCDTGQKHSKDL